MGTVRVLEKGLMDTLTERELKLIAENTDLNVLLDPIRQKGAAYGPLAQNLVGPKGRPGRNAKKLLPGFAVKFFQQGKTDYLNLFHERAKELQSELSDLISNEMGHEASPEEIDSISPEQLKEFLEKYESKSKKNEINLDLIFVQYKLMGISRSEEFMNQMKEYFPEAYEKISEDDKLENEEVVEEKADKSEETEAAPSTPEPKKKTKKKAGKTPEELAAQSKAARVARDRKKEEEERKLAEQMMKEAEEEELRRREEEEIRRREAALQRAKMVLLREEPDEDAVKYFGKVTYQNGYYNFMPVAKWDGRSVDQIRVSELDRILPKSQKRNINFASLSIEDNLFLDKHFYDGQLVCFEFNPEKLEPNTNYMGMVLETGYKIGAREGIESGKIRYVCEEGFYRLIKDATIADEIKTHRIIKINYENIIEGEKILIDLKDGFYAGPFEVHYRADANSFCIQTREQDKKFIVSGYLAEECIKERIIQEDEFWEIMDEWYFYRVKNKAEVHYKDFITNEELLNSFKGTISDLASLEETPYESETMIKLYEGSVLTGDQIPEEIKASRVERLKEILASSQNVETVNSTIFSVVYDMLRSGKIDARFEQILSDIIKKNPGLVENMQEMQVYRDQIERQKKEVEVLKEIKKNLSEDISEADKKKKEEDDEQVKSDELKKILAKLEVANDTEALSKKLEELKKETEALEAHKNTLLEETGKLESSFNELVDSSSARMVEMSFDGFMSSKMLQASAAFEQNRQTSNIEALVEKINSVESPLSKEEVVEYLVNVVQIARPQYSWNTIVNLLICTTQGFLTVLSGTPGCGKTSICNILTKALGLTSFDDILENEDSEKSYNRYIPVSVERGWTSKRDFIGYYNPLTKAFEESNGEVFDGLRILDAEAKSGKNQYPFIILLDEANLSSMEYYWADFMNICDDLKDNHSINLGNHNQFQIPETLHFVATINNDHTTETLSPRLVDRAWVVTLPKFKGSIYGNPIPEDMIKVVSWKDLKELFVKSEDNSFSLNTSTQKIYDDIKDQFLLQGIMISPRVDKAVYNYCTVASEVMKSDEYNTAPFIALDYAISQKVLPKIIGSGEEFEEWLKDLKKICAENSLMKSTDIITAIIDRGNKNMKYYQFFD